MAPRRLPAARGARRAEGARDRPVAGRAPRGLIGRHGRGPETAVRVAQGAYYAVTGVWPLFHMRSFEAVTGPKQEDWLVRTVGLLVSVIGLVMLRHGGAPVRELGAGSALALGAVDVVGVASGRLRAVYLLDAVVEAAIVAAWLAPLIPLRSWPARAPRAPSRGAPEAAR